MKDTTEYRIEYFNTAYKRWEPLPAKTLKKPTQTDDVNQIFQRLSEARIESPSVKFRVALRTCTPWAECAERRSK